MQVLANMQGQYPKEEIVSDIPSVYFISLRTEIVQTMNSTRVDEQFIAKIGQIYAQMLDVAINKLTFPRINLWLTWN